MIKVIDPQIGETSYDGAVGSAGFLCEAYEYLRPKAQTAADYENLARVQVKAKVACAEAGRSCLPVSPDLSSRGVVLPPC